MIKNAYHLTLDTVARALSYLDYNDRKEWYEMAFAIRSEFGENGFSTWEDWGSQYDKYDKAEARAQWRSDKPGGGITIRTLIYRARQAGFPFNDNDRIQISPEEIAARKAKSKADELRYAAELKQIHDEVARIANIAWENATPAHEHPYTTRKGVKIHGARIGNFPVYKTPEPGKPIKPFKRIPALLVPIYAKNGKIVSLQAYFFEDQEYYGDRAYLKSGKKSGGYFLIGTPSEKIAIVEGYATGLSVHEATGWAVMVAFDCSNMVNVANIARDHFPQSEIIIAGDHDKPDDSKTGKRPGNEAAEAAGKAINARVILPDIEGMDWNDVHVTGGLEAVQAQLMAHQLPTPANDNTSPIQFDEYTPFLYVTGNGKPKAVIENVEDLLRRMGAVVRYNVIAKDVEILIPGHSASRDNRLVSCLSHIISKCNLVGIPTGNLEGFLTTIADRNQYNPVLTWVNSKPWDGVKRWDEFCNTITPKNVRPLPDGTPMHIALIKRWMVSAIAAASRDGTSLHGALVLQGDQGLGKTSWLKSLAPSSLDVVKDGLSLNPDNKDSVKKVISFWLVELGEVNGTLKKADQEALKAFLTKDSDEIRLPYARAESDFGRRTAFFGSVNPKTFLKDETGSRRWWVIECESIDYQHTFDMQQVWAEVQAAYESGMQWHLTKDEDTALNASNEDFQVVDPIEERILSSLDWESNHSSWEWVTATEILTKLGIDRPTQGEATKAAMCIRKHNGGESRRYGGKTQLRAPKLVPPKLINGK
ncbi:VapE domain-containing protein [Acinetobacter sp.]|uniref:VapE domain-containing protein n=1 Tax=Acinetobacter sp. TaxID=472 RepID=UPI0031D8F7B5